MKRVSSLLMSAILFLLASCVKEQDIMEEKDCFAPMEFTMPECGQCWQEGDIIGWEGINGHSSSVTLKEADIDDDGRTAVIEFPVPGLKKGRSEAGHFYFQCSPDGECPFTLGASDGKTFKCIQDSAGAVDRSRLFLVSSRGYSSVSSDGARITMLRLGGRVAIRPYTKMYPDEKVLSASFYSSKCISGTVIYNHDSETHSTPCDFFADTCITSLSLPLRMENISSPTEGTELFIVLPSQKIMSGYGISIHTDKATYTVEFSRTAIEIGEDEDYFIQVELDKCTRRDASGQETIPVDVEGISIDNSMLKLKEGETVRVSACITPENATDRCVLWSSADSSVATVDEGMISGVREGETYIYAVSRDGEFTDSCKVYVSKSSFEGVNRHYDVFIKGSDGEWRSIEVHDALCSDWQYHSRLWNDWNNSKQKRDTMSFAIYEDDFSGPVEVRVRKRKGGFIKAEVRPTPYNISVKNRGNGVIEFTIPSFENRKVSVEFDGDRYHNLFLFGARPYDEIPDADSPDVIYFGPGEHTENEISIANGQTLFIDYGAVVYANVLVNGPGCSIKGNGILNGSRLPHYGNTYSCGKILIEVNLKQSIMARDFTMENVTMIDSPAWNIRLTNLPGVLIDGVNMISWILNGDGIDVVCCRDVEIKNCFLRNYDDGITLKMNGYFSPLKDMLNINIHDNIIWSDYARGIVVGPEAGSSYHGTGKIKDVEISDCIILHQAGSTKTDDVRGGFCLYQMLSPNWNDEGGTARNFENIYAKNILFDNIASSGRNVFIRQSKSMDGKCLMKDITLENFTILDGNKVQSPACYIETNQHSITGMHIKNFVFDGTKITAPGENFVISGNVDIDFE